MKFLVDANLPPALADTLHQAGHDAVFIADIASPSIDDPEIIELATAQDRVILTADSDFSAELALSGAQKPSIIFFRKITRRRAAQLSILLLAQIERLAGDLEKGCIVVIEESRTRIRQLPIEEKQRGPYHA